MDKTTAKGLLLPLVMASTGVLVGCTNSDYDFNEIDLTLGFGGNELVIPTSSTKEIALDDILKLNEDDCVKILDNGDYVFKQAGADVEAVHPEIDVVVLTNNMVDTKDLSLDDAFNNLQKVNLKTRAAVEYSINQKETVQMFEYDAIQREILSLTSTNVDGQMTMDITFTENLSKCIATFDEMSLTFPGYMNIEITQSTQAYTLNGNILKFANVPTNRNLTFSANITRFDFNNKNTEYGKLDDIVDGQMHLTGSVEMNVKANGTLNEGVSDFTDCRISSTMSLNDVKINWAEGKFDPEIDLTDLGDVEVSNTPDFLEDDGVVIDLANPQILVEINSDMDVAANINAVIASIKDGVTQKTIDINEIRIHPNKLTQICICRDKSKVDEAYVEYDKYEVADLSELIRTIPDKITFTATTEVDKTNNSSFQLGHPYNIEPSYSIVAPIAFGKDANIVYTDSIDGLYDDIDGLELAEDAYIEVTANVENKLPVYLDTKVTPMDIDGNDLSTSIKITIESNIPAAAENETAHGTIKIKAGGDIKQLDKLKFTIAGKASDGDNSVTGITLNKEKHSLKLDNINAKIVGKVIYDAN